MSRTKWIVGLVLVGCTAGGGSCIGGDTDTEDTDDTDTQDTDTDTVPCPTVGTSGERIACIVALDGDVAAGFSFYDLVCAACHCDNGVGGCSLSDPPAADLTASVLSEENVVAFVLAGSEGTDMDSYAPYPNQQLSDVTTYVLETFISP